MYIIGLRIGDVDADEQITIADATLIQQYLANLRNWDDHGSEEWVEVYKYVADYDGNGERDIVDATRIQQHLAKLI